METTEKTLIKGDIFIIPNELVDLTDKWYKETRIREKYMQKRIGILEALNLPTDELLVEVWACNKDCDNFSSYDYPLLDKAWKNKSEAGSLRGFPRNLPVSIFKDKNDGDTISISYNNLTAELTLNQLGKRYRRFGDFKTVLELLIDKHYQA